MNAVKASSFAVILGLLASCASTPPQNTTDVCSMFDERRNWYKAATRAEKRWDVPVHVSMAFIHQESSFQGRARPPRKKYLGFIPGPRPSTAFGYAQALDTTWNEYKQQAGRWNANRANFSDAVDFIGWYNSNSYRRNGIGRDDAYNLYLAYHEGHGGFSRGTYQNKGWLQDAARRVQSNSSQYQRQYQQCEARLGRNWFLRLFS